MRVIERGGRGLVGFEAVEERVVVSVLRLECCVSGYVLGVV